MATAMYVQQMQEALDGLEQVIDARARELAEMKDTVARMRNLIDSLQRGVDEADVPLETLSARLPPTKSVRNAIADILRDAGAPLHYRIIAEQLQQRGIKFGSRDPLGNVRSHLSHDERFVTLGQGRWDLASRQLRGRGGVGAGGSAHLATFPPPTSLARGPEQTPLTSTSVAVQLPPEAAAVDNSEDNDEVAL